jgi:quinol-cytochrome oxidoreductase complex cytochrome b subunit/mono/diheme cytochrome c family protein
MVVLLGLHMLQVVIAGAHLPPREFNWWLGMGLLGIVLGLSLTGYLLPWDQKGYYATRVATNIAGSVPFIGPFLQKTVVGGPEYGTPTLTRFFALHVAILPAALVVLLIAHVALFRRHGVTAPKHVTGHAMFWPDQVLKDLVACLLVFGVMIFLVLNGHGHHLEPAPDLEHTAVAVEHDHEHEAPQSDLYQSWAKAGREGLGANLDAPADPARQYPARPEWYFLFLFQLLKYFEGEQAIIGTVIIPNAIGALLFILPLLGIGKMRPFGHVFGVVAVMAILAAAASLTLLAVADDTFEAVPHVLLQRIALYVIPAVAGIWLLHIGIIGALQPSAGRAVLNTIGYVVLTVLFLCTAGLIYVAVTPEYMPEAVAEYISSSINANERADVERTRHFEERLEKAKHFHSDLEVAGKEAARAIFLASQGIPEAGSVYLLRSDPMLQFPRLFMKNCAGCHSFGEFPEGIDKKDLFFQTTKQQGFEKAKFTASDLAGFGTKGWIHEFLKKPDSERFYGRSKTKDGEPAFDQMAGWVQSQYEEAGNEEGIARVKDDFGKIAGWLATHPDGPKDAKGKEWAETEHAEAYQLFTEKYKCTRCHGFLGVSDKDRAPDLTGYGSQKWLRKMIQSPGHPRMYGENNLMPTFRDLQDENAEAMKEEFAAVIQKEAKDINFADLSRIDQALLIRFLAHDYRIVFGGQRIVAAGQKEQ